MQRADAFDDAFATLRRILEPHAKTLMVSVEKPGHYQLCSRQMTDRIGHPLFIGAVQIKKNYVSFYLMPVYACPDLIKGLSPALRKRKQGKSCFNFTSIERSHVKELTALTKMGLERFKNVKLPWS